MTREEAIDTVNDAINNDISLIAKPHDFSDYVDTDIEKIAQAALDQFMNEIEMMSAGGQSAVRAMRSGAIYREAARVAANRGFDVSESPTN